MKWLLSLVFACLLFSSSVQAHAQVTIHPFTFIDNTDGLLHETVRSSFQAHDIEPRIVDHWFTTMPKDEEYYDWSMPFTFLKLSTWFNGDTQQFRGVNIKSVGLNEATPLHYPPTALGRGVRNRIYYSGNLTIPEAVYGGTEWYEHITVPTPNPESTIQDLVSFVIQNQTMGEMSYTLNPVEIVQGDADAAVGLRVTYTGSLPLAGLQVNITGADSLARGPDLPSGFGFYTAEGEGGVVTAILLDLEGGLSAGTHEVITLYVSQPVTSGAGVGTQATDEGNTAFFDAAGLLDVTVIPIGDVNSDMQTDLADFVMAIDVALGILPYISAADLYPFPEGDGEVDVRDLNVLGRAILNGVWPNGLPVLDGTSAARGESVATIYLDDSGEELVLWTDLEIRAVQGVIDIQKGLIPLPDATSLTQIRDGKLHFIIYRFAEGPLTMPFASVPGGLGLEHFTNLKVVTPDGAVMPAEPAFGVGDEIGPGQDIPFEVYPNPATRHIQFTKPASGAVYDRIGRLVFRFEDTERLNLARLTSGTYYVRTEDYGTHSFTVLR